MLLPGIVVDEALAVTNMLSGNKGGDEALISMRLQLCHGLAYAATGAGTLPTCTMLPGAVNLPAAEIFAFLLILLLLLLLFFFFFFLLFTVLSLFLLPLVGIYGVRLHISAAFGRYEQRTKVTAGAPEAAAATMAGTSSPQCFLE